MWLFFGAAILNDGAIETSQNSFIDLHVILILKKEYSMQTAKLYVTHFIFQILLKGEVVNFKVKLPRWGKFYDILKSVWFLRAKIF